MSETRITYETPYFETTQEWESLISQGMEARETKDNSQWKLGELASQVETVYGMDSLGVFAAEIGVVKNTLRRYRDVHRAYEGKQRYNNLSFSHHLIALSTDDPQQWLKQASDNNWSCEKLRVETKPSKEVKKRPSVPEWCDECQGWKTRKLCNCSLH